jgi:hypothetical protein
MRKLCIVASLAGVMAATSLFAGVDIVGSVVLTQGPYSYSDGGEFTATGDAGLNALVNWSAYSAPKSTAVIGTSFQTFCIEATVEFGPGNQYDVSLGDSALYGHVGAPPGVPVTMGTAWLYSQFAAGTLGGYDYNVNNTTSANRNADAGALQQAIWYLQGEQGGAYNSFVAEAASYFNVSLTQAQISNGALGTELTVAANGAFGVRALNLWNGPYSTPITVNGVTYNCNQDQLIVAVPEPTTMVAGFGALGFVLLAIRRRSDSLKTGK